MGHRIILLAAVLAVLLGPAWGAQQGSWNQGGDDHDWNNNGWQSSNSGNSGAHSWGSGNNNNPASSTSSPSPPTMTAPGSNPTNPAASPSADNSTPSPSAPSTPTAAPTDPASAVSPAPSSPTSPAAPTPAPQASPTGSSPAPTGAGSYADAALAAHNAARAKYQAPPLTWDASLAQGAQQWSAACNFQHSSGSYGENLGMGYPTIQAVVDAWMSEASSYTFGQANPSNFGQVGHFTQVVWQSTQRVGCGEAACSNGGKMTTCRYDPPGNYAGQYAQNVKPPVA